MTLLSKLTLSEISPRDRINPVLRKRLKLVEQLDIQITAAECVVNDEEYLHSVRQWVRVEGSEEKKLIIKPVRFRYWWWTANNGKVMLALRQGNRVMELGEGKQSIEVGEIDKLPEVLKTLREAVIAGELDEQLKVSPFVRPIPNAKPSKA
jgi:hypothetical protein